MKSDRIKIGIIGCGRAGMIHGRNMAFRVNGVSVVAVADMDPPLRARAAEALGGVKSYADVQELLAEADLDAVVIATPTAFHRELTIMAAEAGKHILCEKPMAMNAEECMAMLAATCAHRVKLQIGFMRRYDLGYIRAREQMDSGLIGRVVQVKSLTHGPSVPLPWMYDLSKSNGPLAEVNSHDIDTLRWFTGSEFKTVYAVGGNYRCPEALSAFPDFYDTVSLCAQFESGMQGVISGAQGVKYGYDARVEILGTEGIIFIGSNKDGSVVACTRDGVRSPFVKSWTDLFAEAYLAEDNDFVRCVLEDCAPKASGLDGLRAVEVVMAGNESIRSGKPVDLMKHREAAPC